MASRQFVSQNIQKNVVMSVMADNPSIGTISYFYLDDCEVGNKIFYSNHAIYDAMPYYGAFSENYMLIGAGKNAYDSGYVWIESIQEYHPENSTSYSNITTNYEIFGICARSDGTFLIIERNGTNAILNKVTISQSISITTIGTIYSIISNTFKGLMFFMTTSKDRLIIFKTDGYSKTIDILQYNLYGISLEKTLNIDISQYTYDNYQCIFISAMQKGEFIEIEIEYADDSTSTGYGNAFITGYIYINKTSPYAINSFIKVYSQDQTRKCIRVDCNTIHFV